MARKSKKDKEVQELQEFLKPGGTGFLRIEDGESAVVYFTEDLLEVPKAWRHSKRIQYRGRWHEFSCIGEDCPLCEHPDENMRRKSRRGRFNMVTQDGTIALRDFGIKFMNQLFAAFEEEDTILDIPFKISRSGAGRATSWTVVPVKADKYPKPKGLSKSDIEEANEAARKEYEERDRDEILEVLQKGYVGKGIVTTTEEASEDEDIVGFLEEDEEEENNSW
jgi:hypothetical protein